MSALRQELGEPAERPTLTPLPTSTPPSQALPVGRRAARLEHRHQLRVELAASGLLVAAVAATVAVLLAAR